MVGPLRIGVFRQWPYVADCVFERRSLKPDIETCKNPGVCAEIVHTILTTMLVDYELVFFDERPEYGVKNETAGTWTGYDQLVHAGTIHLSTVFAGTLYLTDDHMHDFSYTWPLLYFRDSFVIKASHASPIASLTGAIQSLTRMFTWEVWLACAVVFLLACVAYAVQHFNPKVQRVKQMTSLLAIIMLPLYGSVLAVQLAVPFTDHPSYSAIKSWIEEGGEKMLMTESETLFYSNEVDNSGHIMHKGIRVPFDNVLEFKNITHSVRQVAMIGGVVSGSNVRCGTAVLESGMPEQLSLVETPQIIYTSGIRVRKDQHELLEDLNQAILLCFEQLRRIKDKYGVALGEDDDISSPSRESPGLPPISKVDAFGLDNFVGVLYVCGVVVGLAIIAFVVEVITVGCGGQEDKNVKVTNQEMTAVPECFHHSHRLVRLHSARLTQSLDEP